MQKSMTLKGTGKLCKVKSIPILLYGCFTTAAVPCKLEQNFCSEIFSWNVSGTVNKFNHEIFRLRLHASLITVFCWKQAPTFNYHYLQNIICCACKNVKTRFHIPSWKKSSLVGWAGHSSVMQLAPNTNNIHYTILFTSYRKKRESEEKKFNIIFLLNLFFYSAPNLSSISRIFVYINLDITLYK